MHFPPDLTVIFLGLTNFLVCSIAIHSNQKGLFNLKVAYGGLYLEVQVVIQLSRVSTIERNSLLLAFPTQGIAKAPSLEVHLFCGS